MIRGGAKRLLASIDEVVSAPACPSRSAFPQLAPQITGLPDGLGIGPREWLECWGAIDGFARVIVTAERVHLVSDSRAEQALDERHDLRLNNGRLETVDPTAMAELDRLVQVEKGERRSLFVQRRQRGGHLMLRASQVAAPGGMPLVAIAFRLADDRFVPEWGDLGAIFGLTAAEARIVQHLLRGLGADAIAERQKVSINTVRTHISHVYEKLGIACREELWRRLAPYRLN